jgi:hypothetical protein
VKKRLGRSPDLADGLALTFALPDTPKREGGLKGLTRTKQSRDYDPYARM